jgi:hypothetical protein
VTIARQRPKTYWPTNLQTFKRCPRDYYLRYVERHKVTREFDPLMTRGQVTHNLLAQAFDSWKRLGTFPDNLRQRAAGRLPHDKYDSDAQYAYELDLVLDLVDRALNWFDRSATVIATEKTYEYAYAGSRDAPPFSLKTRIDLVLQHDDASLEHVDWKTGSRAWVDEIQNVTGRIVVGRAFQEPRVRSTTYFLGGTTSKSRALDQEGVHTVWKEIKDLVAAIETEESWSPIPNQLCNHCPFKRNGCPLRHDR